MEKIHTPVLESGVSIYGGAEDEMGQKAMRILSTWSAWVVIPASLLRVHVWSVLSGAAPPHVRKASLPPLPPPGPTLGQ